VASIIIYIILILLSYYPKQYVCTICSQLVDKLQLHVNASFITYNSTIGICSRLSDYLTIIIGLFIVSVLLPLKYSQLFFRQNRSSFFFQCINLNHIHLTIIILYHSNVAIILVKTIKCDMCMTQ